MFTDSSRNRDQEREAAINAHADEQEALADRWLDRVPDWCPECSGQTVYYPREQRVECDDCGWEEKA